MSSDESSSDETDPETTRSKLYEELLKKRIFLADRLEKMEKAFMTMGLVSRETTFCSDFELARFIEEIQNHATQE